MPAPPVFNAVFSDLKGRAYPVNASKTRPGGVNASLVEIAGWSRPDRCCFKAGVAGPAALDDGGMAGNL
jgi:hypothetical protein